jgi:hypothetical protein
MTRVLKNGRWKYCSRSYGICFTQLKTERGRAVGLAAPAIAVRLLKDLEDGVHAVLNLHPIL